MPALTSSSTVHRGSKFRKRCVEVEGDGSGESYLGESSRLIRHGSAGAAQCERFDWPARVKCRSDSATVHCRIWLSGSAC